jgi:hypothetical protein
MYKESQRRPVEVQGPVHAAALLPSASLSHFHTTSFSCVDRLL